MPPELISDVFWAGKRVAFMDCTMTQSWGTTPGSATLTVPAATVGLIPEVGDLVLSDGVNPPVRFPQCKVARPVGADSGQGQLITLQILDRRWRWQFGDISGGYNVPAERTSTVPRLPRPGEPLGNAPLDPVPPPPGEEAVREHTRKNAYELARLCLEAMGELRYDISVLDRNAYPTVEWDATPPAQALQQLAEGQGCVVVYRPDTDSVLIARRGQGLPLPNGPYLSDNPGIDAKARPPFVRLYGARVRWQLRFKLDAVGMDFDGAFKPLDFLSYKPLNGWTGSRPPTYPISGLAAAGRLPGGRTDQDAMALAAQWVYRAYRMTLEDPETGELLKLPGEKKYPETPKLRRIRQVRLLPVMNLETKDDIGRDAQAAARCLGRHTAPKQVFGVGKDILQSYGDTTADTLVRVPFSIDAEHQLIVFSDYVYALHADGTAHAAEIVLECACEVQDPDTSQYVRYRLDMPLRGGLPGRPVLVREGWRKKRRRSVNLPAVIVREDVRFLISATYGSDNVFINAETNESVAERRATYHLRGEAARLMPAAAGDRHLPGILPVFPDGALQQVTWSLGGGSPTNPSTRVSRNAEHNIYLPTYEARRRIEDSGLSTVRRIADAVAAVARYILPSPTPPASAGGG